MKWISIVHRIRKNNYYILGETMKKVLSLLSIVFVAQGSLLLGVDHLEKLYFNSPLRATCTDWSHQHVWNTQEQNDACDRLRRQYDFIKEQSAIEHFKSVENDIERRDKRLTKIEMDFYRNALLPYKATWNLIGKILPKADAEQKRIELEELAILKFELANEKRQQELYSVLSIPVTDEMKANLHIGCLCL
jgi:hypothetical protein